ncbi:hypothetical protein HY256_04080, partial [Candidatus Sumerlaeota bacterium]|nr:hypothetical protein [Candidatus Sumerlaeota bacterium]
MNIAFQTAICRLKLRGAGLRGSALHLAGLTGPAPGEVRELFPHLTRGEAVATARSIRSLEARRRVYDDFESRVPLAALAPLVHWKDEEPLRELARNRQPAILLTWHVGIVVGLRAGLHKLGIEAMILRNMIGEGRNEGIHLVGVGRMTPAGRAQALKKTLDHLRDGGIVVVNIDGLQGESRVETNCMGRKVGYAGGVVALARMS